MKNDRAAVIHFLAPTLAIVCPAAQAPVRINAGESQPPLDLSPCLTARTCPVGEAATPLIIASSWRYRLLKERQRSPLGQLHSRGRTRTPGSLIGMPRTTNL